MGDRAGSHPALHLVVGGSGTAITGVHRSTDQPPDWCAGTVQAHTLAYTRYHSDPLALAQISTGTNISLSGEWGAHTQRERRQLEPTLSGILL